jgi:hypothetical protein
MSNALAVAAVTATLRSRLFTALGGADVTTAPPDVAPTSVNGDHVNLFLYRTDLHPAFMNDPMPGTPPGESPRPLLPLVLHYLLASYSDDESRSQQLLGSAMLALQDGPTLLPEEIRQATASAGGQLGGSDLHLQPERVKVTHESLTQDDIAKMWTAFQSPYRTSASYQVSVVLVDSALPGAAPLPVLRRGAAARPDATSPFPALIRLDYPVADLQSCLPGEMLQAFADNLPPGPFEARLRHMRLDLRLTATVTGPIAPSSALRIALPAAGLPAGHWALAIAVPGGPSITNELDLVVRPEVTALAVAAAPAGVTVTVTLAQPVLVGQVADILVGGVQARVGLLTADTADPAVTAILPKGIAKVRMRVDGVDSDIVDRANGGFLTGPNAEVVIP